MKLNQLSVFLENKPGQLKMACQLLAEANISILTLSLADTKQFGILRLIVSNWESAQAILEKAGFISKVTEVAAVEVADRPGGLFQILQAIEACGLNVEYMYAFTFGRGNQAVLIFRFDDVDAAIIKLQEKGVNFVAGADLFARANG
jgi:hypothetical protein